MTTVASLLTVITILNVVFLYVGGGPRLAEVKAAKERDGLDNIRILDYVAREDLHREDAEAPRLLVRVA